jgi:hypothetical protein
VSLKLARTVREIIQQPVGEIVTPELLEKGESQQENK